MLSVILGDIVGSRFEFLATKEREVDFFHPACNFTDDTVCTAAISRATQDIFDNMKLHSQLKNRFPIEYLEEFAGSDSDNLVKIYRKTLRQWCLNYPMAGYGKFFLAWMNSPEAGAYNSLGNGCLMRVSPVVMLANDWSLVSRLGNVASAITHNHPGALASTQEYLELLWLCKTFNGSVTKLKEEFRKMCADLGLSPETVQHYHELGGFHVLAPDTLIRAIACFLEADSWHATVANALYIGSDTDTTAAIAGTFAELVYGLELQDLDQAIGYFNYQNIELLKEVLKTYKQQDSWGSLAHGNVFSESHKAWYREKLLLELNDPTAEWDPLAEVEEEEYYSETEKKLMFEHDSWFGKLLRLLKIKK